MPGSSDRTSGGFGIDGDYLAEVWEVRTRVSPVPELLETPQVWVRFTGKSGWSPGRTHEYDYSHGTVIPGSADEAGFDADAGIGIASFGHINDDAGD